MDFQGRGKARWTRDFKLVELAARLLCACLHEYQCTRELKSLAVITFQHGWVGLQGWCHWLPFVAALNISEAFRRGQLSVTESDTIAATLKP